jgi:hypothetical protein
MRALALDLASETGFVNALAGERTPRCGTWKLKRSGDDAQRSFRKLGQFLRDEMVLERPDIVFIEAPVNLGAFLEKDETAPKGARFRTSSDTISMLHGLVAVVHAICGGCYGITCVQANVQSVRRHFLGVARPQDPKRAVVDRCHVLGYLPRENRNHNIADALALFDWGCATHARVQPRELVMFQEPR